MANFRFTNLLGVSWRFFLIAMGQILVLCHLGLRVSLRPLVGDGENRFCPPSKRQTRDLHEEGENKHRCKIYLQESICARLWKVEYKSPLESNNASFKKCFFHHRNTIKPNAIQEDERCAGGHASNFVFLTIHGSIGGHRLYCTRYYKGKRIKERIRYPRRGSRFPYHSKKSNGCYAPGRTTLQVEQHK